MAFTIGWARPSGAKSHITRLLTGMADELEPQRNGKQKVARVRQWQFECVSCQRYFCETDGTIFHARRSPGELIARVIACLAEGLGIRGTTRGFGIDPNTVLSGLVRVLDRLLCPSQKIRG